MRQRGPCAAGGFGPLLSGEASFRGWLPRRKRGSRRFLCAFTLCTSSKSKTTCSRKAEELGAGVALHQSGSAMSKSISSRSLGENGHEAEPAVARGRACASGESGAAF